jgi:hypothetical protein
MVPNADIVLCNAIDGEILAQTTGPEQCLILGKGGFPGGVVAQRAA